MRREYTTEVISDTKHKQENGGKFYMHRAEEGETWVSYCQAAADRPHRAVGRLRRRVSLALRGVWVSNSTHGTVGSPGSSCTLIQALLFCSHRGPEVKLRQNHQKCTTLAHSGHKERPRSKLPHWKQGAQGKAICRATGDPPHPLVHEPSARTCRPHQQGKRPRTFSKKSNERTAASGGQQTKRP